MPKNRANEQAIHWLHSMKNSDEGFDGINAENALSLIFEQQRKLKLMGATLSRIKSERNNYRKTLTALYEAGKDIPGLQEVPKEVYCASCDELVRPESVRLDTFSFDGYSSAKYIVKICPKCGSDLEWIFLKKENDENGQETSKVFDG